MTTPDAIRDRRASRAVPARARVGTAGTDPQPAAEAFAELRESVRRLLAALLDRGLGLALDKVEQLARSMDEIAARGGPKLGALWGGAKAKLAGRSPFWGAVIGAFSVMSPAAKVAVVAALVLALLLLPVTVVLVLLALIVLAVAAAVRTSSAG